MNTEGLIKVRDAIKTAGSGKFNMGWWVCTSPDPYNGPMVTVNDLRHSCNTAGCIAGWTVATLGTKKDGKLHGDEVKGRAAKLLGLTEEQAERLFVPDTSVGLTLVTKGQALAALNHAIKHGTIKWPASTGVVR